ncbi:hypothetical protein [Polymorphobacter sp. PAMC 29334]|uniref:hypothetical protein n=1 Tax=Polymorphobacter sp. PAMC 29334 TaxID=2862331 RepID=UPI001D0076F1|nr:hypothetical protein [Polymorphobacter sp. PAMC 29334]
MAAALRSSELVALTLADVAVVPEGLRLAVNRSKTDQQGEGAEIAIPEGRHLAPKTLLLAWIALAGFADGPVFRKLTPQGASRRIRCPTSASQLSSRRAAAAGYDPALFGGHPLRVGFFTEAARQGASVFKMREVSWHKSMEVLMDYVPSHELFRDHADEEFYGNNGYGRCRVRLGGLYPVYAAILRHFGASFCRCAGSAGARSRSGDRAQAAATDPGTARRADAGQRRDGSAP